MNFEEILHQLLGTLDITGGFNVQVMLGLLLLTVVGEAYIQIPLLMESVWLMLGYQASMSLTAFLNLLVLFLAAQAGRQIGISTIYLLFRIVNVPLTKFLKKRLEKNKLYLKYLEKESHYDAKFFSLSSATLGMLTQLNGPIKAILILKGKLKILLPATLLSGMTFDILYIIMGAVFHTTSLNLAYLPVCLLIGFAAFVFMKVKILK